MADDKRNHNYNAGQGIKSEDDDYELEMPSCIESLVSSAEQLQQLAGDVGQYYIKTLLCYGYVLEPAITRVYSEDSSSPTINLLNQVSTNQSGRQPQTHMVKVTTIQGADQLDLNKIQSNQRILESMDSLLSFLPFLNELTSFVDRCFATIESTLKRATYFLNKAATNSNQLKNTDQFQLTPDTKIHAIFIAMMDIFYSLVSLDKTIQSHTNICNNLNEFKIVCQLVIDLQAVEATPSLLSETETGSGGQLMKELREIPKDRLKSLIDLIGNIQLTLCSGTRTIFQQCIEYTQHLNLILSKDKTNKGYKNLREHFEDFVLFYGENLIEPVNQFEACDSIQKNSKSIKTNAAIYSLLNLNIIPNLYMNSMPRKVFGLISLISIYGWIFKKQDKRLTKMLAQVLQKFKTMNFIPLLGSNNYIFLNEYLVEHLPKSYLDAKVLKQLQDQSNLLLKLNTSSEFDKLVLKVSPWLIQFKAETIETSDSCPNLANHNNNDDAEGDDGCYSAEALRRQINLVQSGLALIEEINHTIKSIIAIYLNFGKPMTKSNLIPLLRLISLLKSIESSLRENQELVYISAIQTEYSIRTRWRKLMSQARKRLISIRYSERKLDTTSALTLVALCSKVERLTSLRGRTILSFCLSMLVSSLDNNELITLSNLLSLLMPDVYERLDLGANCGYLYWNLPIFSTYYNHSFEEDLCAIREIQYFHMALNDIPSLFLVSVSPGHDNGKATPSSANFNLNWLETKRNEFLKKLGDELIEQLKGDFLDKICQEFEIELRLQIYRDLSLDSHNPFKRHVYNFKQILSNQSNKSNMTFRIFNQLVSLRYYVEQHLNKICYNLTSIAPHDWFTYDSILNLAKHKFNLQFVNSQLPTQTLDYGLDLMDITRNLALFVQRYSYDLINQLFIEKCTNRMSSSSMVSSVFIGGAGANGSSSIISGHYNTMSSSNQLLNVVQIRHIARSIQTHGYGLLNSSVNCTYQVIKRLINLFSRQISDDKLRAILTKEYQRLCTTNHNQSGTLKHQATLSFEKANRMTKRFRSSVTSMPSETNNKAPSVVDLDSIRQSITQLGNLLAFIRMLKSSALNCASESVNYLPDLDNLSILRLNKLVKSEFYQYETQSLFRATENFDQCLADYNENFSPKTNYFNIIIGLFTSILSATSANSTNSHEINSNQKPNGGVDAATLENADNINSDATKQQNNTSNNNNGNSGPDKRDHLRLFFIVVPALTINYIDYIINCKERVLSRSSATRFGALISDDGFSMGVAFLLTVLNQGHSFASLEWFKQVRSKLDEDKREIELRCEDSKYEESLRQTSSMTLRRLQRLRAEYGALEYTLSSALLFFRSSTYVSSVAAETSLSLSLSSTSSSSILNKPPQASSSSSSMATTTTAAGRA